MSLFGTIQQSAGALNAAQIGLQVVGNNIANANTPGYIRQQLEQSSSVAIRVGGLLKGSGVRPTGITQVIDQQLAERMFNAKTDLAGAEALQKAYGQLEELSNDLNNDGLNQQFTLFNNALHELSAQPNDSSLRDFVILQADTLSSSIRQSRDDALSRRELWNGDLDQIATDINRLTERIAKLNLEIATIEGGGILNSDATGLRDQRYRDLEELSEYMNLNIQEQESGAVAVFVGGDYLISNGIAREVNAVYNEQHGGNEVRIVETDSPLQANRGILGATTIAIESVFGDYIDNIDSMASALIRSVNEVHSQGQGREGYDSLLSTVVSDVGVPLKDANLSWLPKNGTFDMSIVDQSGEVISDHRISVRMLGQVTDSTVSSIVAEIDAIDGVTASVTREGRIEILSDSPSAQFTFGEDTSGFLAAAGVNTFFTGRTGFDIAVNPILQENADLLAVSKSGIGEDTDTLTDLVGIIDQPLENLGGQSVRQTYERSVSGLGQKISLQNSSTEGLRNFYATLQSQHLAITGVNIDEESIKMISYQRAFQASSRVISTASEMLELLVSL
ncbi:Flagellar hook-associated protein 1 [Rubripirellula lacrimiformis]|uniref:Flagellar hook-associated protein 1 n=1 Tax=Rubripirellula lacrimiformis TaxID=1930273 RepID=A0A517N9V3_9BACT|nr:flagellar hook-associated protein FlgK [Rubripirellula lacrimiformis]QDT03917.1 Flagellar hook-associated protein 1 [Rubripirellula lacrimiformis]